MYIIINKLICSIIKKLILICNNLYDRTVLYEYMNMKKEKVLVLISIYLYIVVYVTRKDLEIFMLFTLFSQK